MYQSNQVKPLTIWSQVVTTYVIVLRNRLHFLMNWFPDRSGVVRGVNAIIH